MSEVRVFSTSVYERSFAEVSSRPDRCHLCSELASPTSVWNQPLFESENFAVLPSLGALVEGWLLLFPKRHFLSMGALPSYIRDEFSLMKSRVTELVTSAYERPVIFEHGAGGNHRTVGCGVDHAHLHFVPLALDLEAAARDLLPRDAMWHGATLVDCCDAYASGRDYLYLEQQSGRGRIAVSETIGSQVFRKAIARSQARPTEYSWREHPQLRVVAATIATIREQLRPIDTSVSVGSVHVSA